MTTDNKFKVWDLFIRVFHWTLVASFSVAWLTQEQQYQPHLWFGYTVIALVAMRILWGFVGSRHARFSDFVTGPVTLWRYLRSMLSGQSRRYLGHNPAGGMMIVLMILTLLTIGISGIALDGAENWSGPLANYNLFHYTEQIKQLHSLSTDLMLLWIALHLLGVLYSSIIHHENLVKSMISGYKSTD